MWLCKLKIQRYSSFQNCWVPVRTGSRSCHHPVTGKFGAASRWYHPRSAVMGQGTYQIDLIYKWCLPCCASSRSGMHSTFPEHQKQFLSHRLSQKASLFPKSDKLWGLFRTSQVQWQPFSSTPDVQSPAGPPSLGGSEPPCSGHLTTSGWREGEFPRGLLAWICISITYFYLFSAS